MFQFTPFPHTALFYSHSCTCTLLQVGSPIRKSAVHNGYLLLTAAYRSLSRPSSAPSAKASALCSFSLDLLLVFFTLCFVAFSRFSAHVPMYAPLLAPSAPCSSRKILRSSYQFSSLLALTESKIIVKTLSENFFSGFSV